ncbi:MAG: Asp-tRNA(Asn)/Glu-tRNA(Gln) amidotransferase subunit GatA [Clostridiales bacterium]|jgi:aspartyl-tRNA(Asn)/glutamyl-tRNA(Gln) amidotransferase subunit A|nr:Asp-tRNA(Asn)/Glu-tRNA(Gln) amidotransferase subunit GatA [Clostridiales bacterium]
MPPRIAEIHEKLKKRELSAVEIAKAYIGAVERLNPELGAYITLTPDAALAGAAEADKLIALGGDIPPLCGVPMTVKDNISTKGVLTTCGSNILNNYYPAFDAEAVTRLNAAGAVLLGKTNLDEFAMGSTCETSFYGTAKNPHDTGRVPGGSSGGGAAAVAAGIAAYAIGSDTGGSIRVPASFCGVFGLKPTYGAVSRYGLIAYASSFDQIGVIAESAEDAACVFDAISGHDPKDMTSDPFPRGKTLPGISDGVCGLRIGVLTNLFEGLNPVIADKIGAALGIYESLGASVEPVSIEQFDMCLPVYYILACAEASSNLARFDGVRYGYRAPEYRGADEMIRKTRSEGFGREVKRRIMLGNYVLSSGYFDAYYKKAQLTRGAMRRSFSAAFEKADVIVCPTVAVLAPKLGDMMNADPVEMYLTDMCTVSVNICGLPAVSVPVGADRRLPIGMQLIGAKFSEGLLLRAARAFELAGGVVLRPAVGGDPLAV